MRAKSAGRGLGIGDERRLGRHEARGGRGRDDLDRLGRRRRWRNRRDLDGAASRGWPTPSERALEPKSRAAARRRTPPLATTMSRSGAHLSPRRRQAHPAASRRASRAPARIEAAWPPRQGASGRTSGTPRRASRRAPRPLASPLRRCERDHPFDRDRRRPTRFRGCGNPHAVRFQTAYRVGASRRSHLGDAIRRPRSWRRPWR